MPTQQRSRLVIIAVVIFVLGLAGIIVLRFRRHGQRDMNLELDVAGPLRAIPEASGILSPVARGAADWPCWRGGNGDGKSTVRGIRKDWSEGLKRLWQVDYLCQGKESATWSAPAVQGNRLVVPGRDQKSDIVFCLDPNNGSLLWVESYQAETGTSHGPGPRATPYIDDDRVYTYGRSGDLACWRLENGELLWKHNVGEIGGKTPKWGLSSSPPGWPP